MKKRKTIIEIFAEEQRKRDTARRLMELQLLEGIRTALQKYLTFHGKHLAMPQHRHD